MICSGAGRPVGRLQFPDLSAFGTNRKPSTALSAPAMPDACSCPEPSSHPFGYLDAQKSNGPSPNVVPSSFLAHRSKLNFRLVTRSYVTMPEKHHSVLLTSTRALLFVLTSGSSPR
jgi:hypothetical protein